MRVDEFEIVAYVIERVTYFNERSNYLYDGCVFKVTPSTLSDDEIVGLDFHYRIVDAFQRVAYVGLDVLKDMMEGNEFDVWLHKHASSLAKEVYEKVGL